MKRWRACYFLLGICLFPFLLSGQNKWQSGVFLGGATYQGDMVEPIPPYLSEVDLAIGVINQYALSRFLNLRADLLFARLKGRDSNGTRADGIKSRNAHFETQIGEFTLWLAFEPFKYRRDSVERADSIAVVATERAVHPYLGFGGGIARVQPNPTFDTDLSNGILERIEMDRNAQFPDFNFVLPLMGGVKFNLSESVDLGFEISTRATFTDYIDGISESGNPDRKDWYWYGGAHLGLKFLPRDSDKDGVADKEDDCPKTVGTASTMGCPDRDGDGVGDRADLCPDVFGTLTFNGCPDTDEDGIMDVLDNCPTIAGTLTTNGCPDMDMDAIQDEEDQCPNLMGSIEGNGCPPLDANGNGSIADELAAEVQDPTELTRRYREFNQKYSWLNKLKLWAYLEF